MQQPTVIATRDVDVARRQVGDLFCAHRLEPAGAARDIDMKLRVDQMGSMGIVHLDYGEPVGIKPQPLQTFFLVQIPLAGRALIEQGGQRVQSTPQLASVLSPTQPATMLWQRGNPQRCVYLSRDLVENELMLLTGEQLREPLRFDLGMDFRRPDAASWLRTIAFVNAEARQGGLAVSTPSCSDALARTVANMLLLAQPHNYRAALERVTRATRPLGQRLISAIDAHLAEPLTPAGLAEFLGVSLRTLRETCRTDFATTPVALIKERRLLAARLKLQHALPGDRTVTDVALSVGCTHLGRFAGDYRGRFGESPSDTAARAQTPARHVQPAG